MVQYDVLKEQWKTKLTEALSSDGSLSEALDCFLHPSYFDGDTNQCEHDVTYDSSLEKQQLLFLRIEAKVCITCVAISMLCIAMKCTKVNNSTVSLNSAEASLHSLYIVIQWGLLGIIRVNVHT